jgi:hypothetical protein
VELVGGAGEVLVIGGQALELALHLPQQLAVVQRLDDADLSRAGSDHVGQPAHQTRALDRGHPTPRPVVERAACRLHRAVDVGRTRPGDDGPGLAGVGIGRPERLARLSADPVAVDVHPVAPRLPAVMGGKRRNRTGCSS